MSCVQCQLDYLQGLSKLTYFTARRMNNVLGYSENSQETSDAQRANNQDFNAFEEWKRNRASEPCPHKETQDADGTSPRQFANSTEVFGAEDDDPPPPLTEVGGNIGLNSVASRSFHETAKPIQGSKGGRPPKGVSLGTGSGRGASTGKGTASRSGRGR